MPNLGMLGGGGGGGASERPGGLGRPDRRAALRPADTAAEPNRRNLTGRAEPPPRVPPVHSVQPLTLTFAAS